MRFRRLAGSEIQTDGATELKKCLPKDIKLRLEMLSLLARGSVFDRLYAERSRKVRQECTAQVTIGKSCHLEFTAEFHKAADGVHLTVVSVSALPK